MLNNKTREILAKSVVKSSGQIMSAGATAASKLLQEEQRMEKLVVGFDRVIGEESTTLDQRLDVWLKMSK